MTVGHLILNLLLATASFLQNTAVFLFLIFLVLLLCLFPSTEHDPTHALFLGLLSMSLGKCPAAASIPMTLTEITKSEIKS